MARLAILGAETGDLSELTSTNGCSISSAQVKTGSYSYLITGSATGRAQIDVAASEIWVGFYYRTDATNITFAKIRSDVDNNLLLVSGKLQVTAGGGTGVQGTTTLSTNTWYFIELRYKAGTGSNAILEVRLNGVVEATSSNGTSTANASNFQAYASSSVPISYFDDIRIDNAGYPGDGFIQALRPNAAGDENGATGTFADIDDDPINDTTGRTESGGPAFVNNLTTIASVGTINAVKAAVRASRSNGTARTHFIRVKRDASTENSADLVLSGTVGYYQFFSTIPPTTQAELDAYQGGMSQSAAGGRVYTCTEFWLMVDYTPTPEKSLVFSPTKHLLPMLMR